MLLYWNSLATCEFRAAAMEKAPLEAALAPYFDPTTQGAELLKFGETFAGNSELSPRFSGKM
jgi:hypothetical protein